MHATHMKYPTRLESKIAAALAAAVVVLVTLLL
jgi:hypothetical protein